MLIFVKTLSKWNDVGTFVLNCLVLAHLLWSVVSHDVFCPYMCVCVCVCDSINLVVF